jgi:hypothetical protein
MTLFEAHEISKHASYEPFGYVFIHKGALYRGIYPAYEKNVLEMFQCGLMAELIQNGLFPESVVTDYRTTDCNLVIQHEKVSVVTLPIEWSFSMLKDAALTTLKTNIIARKYGYQTKDAHGFNVLFRYGTPLFIDLGSFVKIQNDFSCAKAGWWAYGEFMRYFYAPLSIWSHGDSFFARHSLHGDQLPMSSYWRYRNFFLRLVPPSILNRLEFFYYKYKGLNTRSIDEFRQFASRSQTLERLAQWIIWLARRRLLLFSSVDLDELYKRVNAIRPPAHRSEWGEYQSNMEVSERHRYIVNWIKELAVKSVLDLGGNAGLLARLVLSETKIDYAVCADYDENAIDSLYRSLHINPAKVFPVLLNFSISIADTKFATAQQRLRSEAVLALALTHHLVLSQGMSLDFVFDRLRSFATKYVFVEFMPLGCYSSRKKKLPTVPEWYNLEWFRTRFDHYFEILDEKQLDKNRILFVGLVRADGSDQR